jgi:hypothetical protein
MKKRLLQSTIEKLGYYVYALIDPRTKKVFYIGKGKGSRIYAHLEASELIETREVEKIATIREIRAAGKEVGHTVVRHGLTESEAFSVEAALIDYTKHVQKLNLTNLVDGHHSGEVGLRSIEDIEIQYEAPEAVFEESMILIRVNREYRPGMKPKELYDATRMQWRVGPRAFKLKYACAVYLGIVREVYEIKEWEPMEIINGFQRHGFTGKVAPPAIRDKYRHTSVKHVFKQGQQSSITYVEPSL